MIGYLGTPGALAALPYRGGLDTSSDRPVSFTRTLGGKRKAFVGPRSRREWGVSFDLVGSGSTHGLLAVAQVATSVLWYPADATSGNMLSPQAAGFATVPNNGVAAGLVALPDGSVAHAISRAESGPIYVGGPATVPGIEAVPVTPGQRVSVGAWATGTFQGTVLWRDKAGANISSANMSSSSGTSVFSYRSGSFTAPANAAFVGFYFSTSALVARPTISWGDVARDRPGRGCPSALVHGLSEALTVIAGDDAYGSIDVTISEVG